jgi:hypothetical protein
MSNEEEPVELNRAKRISIALGALGGALGAVHGIGEIQQGSVTTDGIFIEAFSGAAAMTIIPNFLVTGILALIASLSVFVLSAVLYKKNYDAVILGLSMVMLLVGAGFFPPILTSISAIISMRTKR